MNPTTAPFPPSHHCSLKPPISFPNAIKTLPFGFELRRKGSSPRRTLKFLVTAQLPKPFSLNFGLDSQSLNSIQSYEPSQLHWMGPVPGDIAEVEAYCRIFRNYERLHSALMNALCNPFTGECSVSYEVPPDEKPVLEDKIVSVLGCMVALVNTGREDVLSGRTSVMTLFRDAEVSAMDDALPPLAIFRSEMKRCCESLHVALENYLVPDDDQSLDVWRKLQGLKNVCYDSGFPREEDHPYPELFANWSPVYLSTSKVDTESNDPEAAFWIGGQVTEEGLKWLLDKGYKTIIDLREETVKDNFHQEAVNDAISSGKIELVKIPVQVRTAPTMEQVERFAFYVSDCSKRPIYLHSKEGVWRTSAMVSRWRQYMTHFASAFVSNEAVTSNDMSSDCTNESGKLQDSSMTAERSSLEKDNSLLQVSSGTAHCSVGKFNRSTFSKKDNGKTQSNGPLSGAALDDSTSSQMTAPNAEVSFTCFSSKTIPLEAQVPPCDVFSKKEMSKFMGNRKISRPAYFEYQLKRLEYLADSRNIHTKRLQGGLLINNGDNPVPKIVGPESSNGSAHVDYPSGEPHITVGDSGKSVNRNTSSSVGTTVNGFSEEEAHYMMNANVSTIVNNDIDNVATNSQKVGNNDCKAELAIHDEGLELVEGDMRVSSTGVVRVQSRKKAEMFLVRTDGISCAREKVTESSLAFTHPSTQQQMLLWKSSPKTVLLLKKPGEQLMEEAKEVIIFFFFKKKV